MRHFWIFTVAFLLVGIGSIAAQDLIIMRDGNIIEARVMEISPTEIRYKRFEHLEGPTIVLPALNVLSIRYENGTSEIINAVPVPVIGQQNIQVIRSQNAQVIRSQNTAMDTDKFNFGISLNPGGLIPFTGGGGLSISLDFNKGRFNSIVDIRSGFGAIPTGLFTEAYEWFGISSSFNYFHPSHIGGFFVGGLLVFSIGEEYRWWPSWQTYVGFGLALNIGYKFVTQSGVYFRTGANIGYTFGLWDMIIKPDLAIGWTMK